MENVFPYCCTISTYFLPTFFRVYKPTQNPLRSCISPGLISGCTVRHVKHGKIRAIGRIRVIYLEGVNACDFKIFLPSWYSQWFSVASHSSCHIMLTKVNSNDHTSPLSLPSPSPSQVELADILNDWYN